MASLTILFLSLVLITLKTLSFYLGFNWLLVGVFPSIATINFAQAFALLTIRSIIFNTSSQQNKMIEREKNPFKALTNNLTLQLSILIIIVITHYIIL